MALADDPDDRVPTESDLARVDDVAYLLERAYRRFEDLRPTLTPEKFNAVLTLRAIGRTFTLPRWAILRHIVNHSGYHCGQVASKLKRLGIEQQITDFFWWVIRRRCEHGDIHEFGVSYGTVLGCSRCPFALAVVACSELNLLDAQGKVTLTLSLAIKFI